MFRKSDWRMRTRLLLLIFVLLSLAAVATAQAGNNGSDFVKRSGAELRLHGRVFRFAGTNNYYLMYKSQFMVDDVLETAAANGFTVLRTWGFLDIGNQDGSNSVHGKADGVYFHYWDGNGPAFNDGADGLEHLDYVVYKAGQEGIKLVIPLTNNWRDFGGMDQYVRWRGGAYHDDFYTDPVIRQWYKDWIAHLLNRTNIYTGLKYKDDPTIMTWELGNEPRCIGSGVYPRSANCTTETLIAWADDVSHFIKSIDSKHLVSVGDEGFYCIPGAADWTENCNEGVDTLAFASLPKVDVLSFHLYPDSWGKDVDWSTEWIERHIADAQAINRPAVFGEYGLQDKSIRNVVYQEWTNTVFENGGSGALYWILSGLQDDGSYYPDYDGFTVYCPSPVCITISNFAAMMTANQAMVFPPVADHDTAVTEFETAVTLDPPANDITYGSAVLEPSTVDLDPETTGQQVTRTVPGGTFEWQPDGMVLFTPAAGFSGQAAISYTIADSDGRTSNAANLSVIVLPSPTAPIVMFSFETGTEGWAPGSWQSNAGSVAQSAAFHTDGSYSLRVETNDGGWFGLDFAAPVDLSNKTTLKIDLQTTGAGTSTNIALKLGSSWTWCQGSWGWVNPGTTTTIELDLLNLGCTAPDLSQVNGIFVWVSGGGTFYLDYVRGE
ncbi:MAG: cellulase family glycosylhydrolase [Chloroflexi bacterium]|nr:cellulase family glycosylhydrolase [Chloroflexota bacterium]MCI0575440.1 cellulase family glycosylhydrolase [Chloroflexota bacterium]MCI0649878.1 cellulase family glycosylhydrolase [Chloroflexota bacterium]MCI0725648.1 cellulase family glycosylhydrolase [Chloroflexota bacterium]